MHRIKWHIIYGALSPISQPHGSRNQEVAAGVAPPTFTLPRRIFISCPKKSSSVKLEFRFLFGVGSGGRWRTFPPTDARRIPLTWKLCLLAPGHFGLLMMMNQQAEKKVLPADVINNDYHEAFRLLLHNKMKGLFVEPRGFSRSFLNIHIAQ